MGRVVGGLMGPAAGCSLPAGTCHALCCRPMCATTLRLQPCYFQVNLRTMNQLAKILRRKRADRGALSVSAAIVGPWQQQQRRRQQRQWQLCAAVVWRAACGTGVLSCSETDARLADVWNRLAPCSWPARRSSLRLTLRRTTRWTWACTRWGFQINQIDF